MNTKHEVHIYNKCSAQFKATRKILMQMAECQEGAKKTCYIVMIVVSVAKQSQTLHMNFFKAIYVSL